MDYKKIIRNKLESIMNKLENEIGEKYTLIEISHMCNYLGLDTESVDELQVVKECMLDSNISSIAYYLKDDKNNYDFINVVIEKFNKNIDIDLNSEWIIKEIEIL